MAVPDQYEWPWLIQHHRNDGQIHDAWYQRALICGDFAPGRRGVLATYIATLDGRIPGPNEALRCGTCNQRLQADDVDAVERITGETGFLRTFRLGRRPWPLTESREQNCYHCNREIKPGEQRRPVALELVAELHGLTTLFNGNVLVCGECFAHIDRGRDGRGRPGNGR
jgi:hypothetical protein